VSDFLLLLPLYVSFVALPALGTYWFGRSIGNDRDLRAKRHERARRPFDELYETSMGLAVAAAFVTAARSSADGLGVFDAIGFFAVAAAVLIVPLRIGYASGIRARLKRERTARARPEVGDDRSDEDTD
jgi:putative Mn2+ efflux pump MntP